MTAKVQALAETLRSVGATPDTARDMDEIVWALVASLTPPCEFPTEDEKRAVYAALEEMEAKCPTK